MKAMVAGYTHQPKIEVPRDWLNALYAHHSPPKDGWVVFATAYQGVHPAYFASHRISLSEIDSGAPVDDNEGISLTLIVGYLALKVIGVHRKGVSNSGTQFLQVWPSSRLILLWPPSKRITDDILADFFRTNFLLRNRNRT